MKYIKEYNEHSYYQRLPYMATDDILFDEFLDITDKALSFTPGEIMSIKRLIKRVVGNSNIPYIVSQKLRCDLGGEGYDPVQIRTSFNNDDVVLCIYKAVDEWYYVITLGFDGYKCDQLEGLDKFIEYFYEKTYKGYDFNKWVKLEDGEVISYVDSIKLSNLDLLDTISKWQGIPISSDIEKELLLLSKLKWAGLVGLNFVRKELGKYVWIGSSIPHYVDDREEEPVVGDDDLVEYQPTGIPVEYYINIYKKSDNLYLLEEVTQKKGYKNYSEFFRCNSFEGVRDCIKFILRRRNS